MPSLSATVREQLRSPSSRERARAAAALRHQPGNEAVRELLRLLGDQRSEVAYQAAQSLVDMDDPRAAEGVAGLFGSENSALRNLAFDILVRMGDKALVPVVEKVADPDRDVRKFAVDALAGMRLVAAETPLIRALFDPDNNVAMAAAEALGNLGASRATPHLVECVHKGPWLNYAAIKSLGQIGGEEALNALLEVDDHEDRIVLYHTIDALGRIGDPRATDKLIGLFESGDPALRPPVIQALSAVLDTADEAVVNRAGMRMKTEQMLDLLEDTNPAVIRGTITLLGLFGASKAVPALARLYREGNASLFKNLEQALIRIGSRETGPLVRVLEDPAQPESVKLAVLDCLARLKDTSVQPVLLEYLTTSSDTMKAGVLRTLGHIGTPDVLPILVKELNSDQEDVREGAVDGLEHMHDPAAVPALLTLAGDPSPTIRKKGAACLQTFGPELWSDTVKDLFRSHDPRKRCFVLDMLTPTTSMRFEEEILELSTHADESVRQKGTALLGSLGTDRAFDALVAALQDPLPAVRIAAVRALQSYPKRTQTPDLLLQTAGNDPDPWTRYEAVRMMGTLGLAGYLSELTELMRDAQDLVRTGILDVFGMLGGADHLPLVTAWLETGTEPVRESASDALTLIHSRTDQGRDA